jgi:hypothetical protein
MSANWGGDFEKIHINLSFLVGQGRRRDFGWLNTVMDVCTTNICTLRVSTTQEVNGSIIIAGESKMGSVI